MEALLFILKVFSVAISILFIILMWAAMKVYVYKQTQPDESDAVRKYREAQRDRGR